VTQTKPIAPRIHIALTHGPIDHHSFDSYIADPDSGSHAWFLGVTRRTTDDRITEHLFYEAHESMAKSQMNHIAISAASRFNLFAVVIIHRLGKVDIGQSSIAVGCSSAHRIESFEALAWIMDEIKRDVPIWKRETYAGGQQEWVHPVGPS
jgi:molybdopterin synthase catalytic subunit